MEDKRSNLEQTRPETTEKIVSIKSSFEKPGIYLLLMKDSQGVRRWNQKNPKRLLARC